MNRFTYPFRTRSRRGFTIVELLIVIVVIAILAAIAIVAYNGISQRGKESAVRHLASQAARKVVAESVTNAENYPTTLASVGITDDTNTTYEYSYNNTVPRTFCITVTFQSVSYWISSTSQSPTAGTCPGHIGAGPTGPWTDIAVGAEHTCGIYEGAAYCWGRSQYGEIGDGTLVWKMSPVAVNTATVLSGKTVTDIDAGPNITCAVADGAAYCWGRNTDGQLGDGTTTSSSVPVAVDTSGVLAGKTVTKVSVGALFVCALADGAAYCWGSDANSALGNGAGGSSSTPVAVDATGVLAGKTVTGLFAGWRNACVIADEAYCWGTGAWGAVGSGTTSSYPSPVALDMSGYLSGKTITTIDGGEYNACSVAGGEPFCWGYNQGGMIGSASAGTEEHSPYPTDVSGVLSGKTVSNISVGGGTTCSVADGALYCWGAGTNGALGNGATANATTATAVDMSGVMSGTTATQVSTSLYTFSCAIASGQAYCWGLGTYGRLGNGQQVTQTSPVTVVNPS